jgi:flavodoxin long chain
MIAVIYGSTTGNTSDAAVKIAKILGEDQVELFDVKDVGLAALEFFDNIIFAIPTWDYGEVQADWQDVLDEIDDTDFSSKTVAFLGMGDQFAYAEWFQDAMGMLHDKVVAKGAKVIGHWPVDGYEFDASKALTADKQFFVGLALDEDCQPELTEGRLKQWCEQLKSSLLKAA